MHSCNSVDSNLLTIDSTQYNLKQQHYSAQCWHCFVHFILFFNGPLPFKTSVYLKIKLCKIVYLKNVRYAIYHSYKKNIVVNTDNSGIALKLLFINAAKWFIPSNRQWKSRIQENETNASHWAINIYHTRKDYKCYYFFLYFLLTETLRDSDYRGRGIQLDFPWVVSMKLHYDKDSNFVWSLK